MALLLERIYSHSGSKFFTVYSWSLGWHSFWKEFSPTVGANSLPSAPRAWDGSFVGKNFSPTVGAKNFLPQWEQIIYSLILGPEMTLLLERIFSHSGSKFFTVCSWSLGWHFYSNFLPQWEQILSCKSTIPNISEIEWRRLSCHSFYSTPFHSMFSVVLL